jgi:hypothetical protein
MWGASRSWGASGRIYLGARLGLGFKELTVAGTPNFSTLSGEQRV